MTNYATLLKESGLKATFQRMNILEVIEKHGHMAIEAIYDEVVKIHPSLSLATIYKNIFLMTDKGVLVEVPIAGKKPKYELKKSDHIHLVCIECGEVEDKPYLESADKILYELVEKEQFRLHKRQINLYGVCSACQLKETL
jgi:Fur family ferric uptake transcriptional regulator/Fur family peroxide stress response transcriptional regulator